jgi:hypothetical protein
VALERIVGTLQVTARPPGARVQFFPGGLELGPVPVNARVPVGEGRVTITLAGYVTQTREALVRADELTTLDLELQRAADRAASLTVVGRPEGASVRVAGREVGKLPLTLSGLDPGRLSVELSLPDHDPWRSDLLLEAGTATRVDAVLRRPEDRPWAGWKWLGYGAGAALVGAGGVVGYQARGAHDDFDASPSTEGKSRVERLNHTADGLLIAGAVTLASTALLHLILGPRSESHASVSTRH